MAKIELQIGEKTYNKAWIDNLSSTSQTTSDGASINYGVVPSTGNATLHDINGQIRADIENGVLPVSNAPTKVRLNDTQVQEHTTSDSDYSIIDKELDLQFSDRLSLLDKVTYGGMPLRDYQMTAYEMLDDVIGSYGGYCRERPINWTKYQNGDNIETETQSSVITVATSGGWEIIGTPIKVAPNKAYKVSYSIYTNLAYTVDTSCQGVAVQILHSIPTDSNCEDIALASAFLDTSSTNNLGTLNFTPTTNTVYFVLNFGYASDNQAVKVRIDSVKVGEKSLSIATQGNKFLREYVSSVAPYTKQSVESIENYLDGMILQYPYLPSATYRETIEKFCTLGQITLALDNDGNIYFYDARPCKRYETPKEISKTYQISNLNKTLFVKNKIDGVDIKQDKVVVNLDIGAAFQTDSTKATDFLSNTNNQSVSAYKDSNITGYQNEYAKAYINSYYTSLSVVIPKKSEQNKKSIMRILSGVDSNGNPNVKYVTTYTKNVGTATVPRGQSSTTIEDITLVQTSSSNGSGDIPISYAQTNTATGGGSITATATFVNLSNNGQQGIFLEDDSNYYVTLLLLCGGLFVGVNGSQELSTTKQEFLGEQGQYEEYIPQKVEITFYGDVQTISFEEVDLSTAGIESADNAVSIPTNELMQNEKNVVAIRDNILEDYANGIPTATIDLFYNENNKINKGDIIYFNDDLSKSDDVNLWKVTGKTLSYKGYPSLSLELQQQRAWHTAKEWKGSLKAENISSGDFTTSSTKSGSITLPSAFSKGTLIVADITYGFNSGDATNRAVGVDDVENSRLIVGTVRKVNCDLSLSADGTKINYTADEVYHTVLGIVYRGYVKSIEIIQLSEVSFY